MSEGSASSAQAWSAYWSSGALHACATSFSGNYAGAIAAFWRGVFGGMRGHKRMLDLATGNGALPQLAIELARDATLQIDAVDLADLFPERSGQTSRDAVRFHAGVALEALPFADGAFDLVTSQYGIEYARWPDALDEALRVCRTDGTFACVLHHADSVVVRVGRQEVANLSLLLGDDGLLAAARGAIPWLAAGERPAPGDGAAARQAYNRAMTEIAQALDANPVPDLLLAMRHEVHALMASVRQGETAPQRALQMLDAHADALSLARMRTMAMQASARDLDGIEAMAAHLQARRPGRSVKMTALRQVEGLLGWGVVSGPP